MNTTRALLLTMLLSVCAFSQSIAATNNCALRAMVWDDDTTGTNIRDNPKGAIVDKIHPSRAETGFVINLLGSDNHWLRCQYPAKGNRIRTGWIFGGVVRLDTRNYGDQQTFNLYASPDTRSKVLKKIAGERSVQVLGCDKDWAYIKVVVEGKAYFGWLEPNMQCANAVTNCC